MSGPDEASPAIEVLRLTRRSSHDQDLMRAKAARYGSNAQRGDSQDAVLMEQRHQLGCGPLYEPDGKSVVMPEMPERDPMAAEADVLHGPTDGRLFPAGWDPYEVWLTRVRPQYVFAQPAVADTLAPRHVNRLIRTFMCMLLGIRRIRTEHD